MNLLDLPETLLYHVLNFLDIKFLVKISEVCKYLNFISKEIKPVEQLSELENIFETNYFFDTLYRLNFENYIPISKIWKNILFILTVDYVKESEILERENPPNIVFSISSFGLVDIQKIHPSIKYLDCPLKMVNSTPNISDNFVYLNMTEQIHIFDTTDFSSCSLKHLDISFSDLLNVNLNFSKNLKTVNIMGAINLYSLSGFEYVEKLNIDYCDNLKDLSPLKRVKFLSMRHCEEIKDVPFLENLEILDISYSKVEDISKARNLKKVFFKGINDIKINLEKYTQIDLI